jgi:NADH-quinone oxidoreductase subunit J
MTAFYVLGAIVVGASLLVIAQRNPIHSVMLLIVSFAALSGLYILLDAPFVAVTQIIVYAGAIMVLFLFVVMLLNAPQEETPHDASLRRGQRRDGARLAALLALALAAELVWALTREGGPARFARDAVSSVAVLGRALFTDYAFQFEVTSVLILVAMIGAVVLARREDRPIEQAAATDRERSQPVAPEA